MGDLVLAVFLLCTALFASQTAIGWKVPFAYDPLGPKAFPLLLSLILAILSTALILRTPRARMTQINLNRTVAMSVILLFYALAFDWLGFVGSSWLSVLALARLFDASWRKSILAATIISIFFSLMFHNLFGLRLPIGQIFAT